MKISYKTLKQLISFDETPGQLDALLTATGLEVEGLEEVLAVPGGLKGLLVGEVKTCVSHPNADKLRITTVDVGGKELLQIVCGAPNVAAGQKVIVATVGAELFPKDGDSIKIKKSKIRGEVSQGMICAEDEIGMGEGHDGIMVLNTDLANGTTAAEYFNLESDFIIEIGLTPNRADGASHYGVARDIKAVNGNEVVLKDVSHIKEGTAAKTIELEIEDADACPRFNGLEIRNIEIKESPDWLKAFLTTIGLKPINAVVDITNYVCHFLGQPMHIFDADKIRGQKVIVKKPAKGTKLTTLDEIERTFNGNELAICDAEGPMAIAGVFGGLNSGVSKETKNIFLEVAYFNPDDIRRAATNNSLNTDASFRYERGTDPEMPPYAIRFAADLIETLAGGTRCNQIFDQYPHPIQPKLIEITVAYINRLIGKEIKQEKIVEILERLDIKVLAQVGDTLKLQVPAYRVDVTREADIVEEVLRVYGFGQITESHTLASSFLSQFPLVNAEDQQVRIAEVLAASGLHEIQSLSIVNPSQNALVDNNEASTVKLLNPLSEELSEMRKSLLFSGLESLAYNINRKAKDIGLFEFGRIYTKSETEEGSQYKDQQVLGLWLTGNRDSESWLEKAQNVTLFDLKKQVEKVLQALRMPTDNTDEVSSSHFSYGIGYKVNNKEVAVIGRVKDALLKKSGIKQEVFYAELDWAYLLKKYKPEVTFTEIPKFPAVKRDLSLVIDKSVSFNQVVSVAKKTEKKLLKSINIFDVYEGDKIEQGKKAYAVSFILQDETKTLQDKFIDKTMSKLIHNFENELKAVIRK